MGFEEVGPGVANWLLALGPAGGVTKDPVGGLHMTPPQLPWYCVQSRDGPV